MNEKKLYHNALEEELLRGKNLKARLDAKLSGERDAAHVYERKPEAAESGRLPKWIGIPAAAVLEVLSIEVGIYLRTFRVTARLRTDTAHGEVLAVAVGFGAVVVGEGVEDEAPALLAVADVHGHGYGDAESPGVDAVGSVVEHVVVGVELEGRVGAVVVVEAGDVALAVVEMCRHYAVEVV